MQQGTALRTAAACLLSCRQAAAHQAPGPASPLRTASSPHAAATGPVPPSLVALARLVSGCSCQVTSCILASRQPPVFRSRCICCTGVIVQTAGLHGRRCWAPCCMKHASSAMLVASVPVLLVHVLTSISPLLAWQVRTCYAEAESRALNQAAVAPRTWLLHRFALQGPAADAH